VVVGWLDAVCVGEGPEAGPAFEEVAGERAVVPGSRAFPVGALEEGAEGVLQEQGSGLELAAVAVFLVGVPGGEEFACDLEAGLAELFPG